MPKRTQSHEEFLAEYLQDPREAALYLNAALEDSDESFLEALRDVATTVKMSALADNAGVARQAAYRMLSKAGNPTYSNLTAILRVLGLRIAIEADIIDRTTQVANAREMEVAEIVGSDNHPPETISTDRSVSIHHVAGRETGISVWTSNHRRFNTTVPTGRPAPTVVSLETVAA